MSNETEDLLSWVGNKNWRTIASNLPVRFLGLLNKNPSPYVIAVMSPGGKETTYCLTKSFVCLAENPDEPFIFEAPDYASWPIDTPVVAYWLDTKIKHDGYFAGVDGGGYPMTWSDGATSKTTENGNKTSWGYAEKA